MKGIEATATSGGARRSRWPLLIVGLLSGHVLLMVVACTIAVRDKTFAVVPDYYGRALDWDQAKAARIASQKLGWHIEIQASPRIDSLGLRTVSFVLTDPDGRSIEGASLHVVYFHDAHAAARQQVTLSADPTDPRRFTAKLPMPYEGDWEFHFTATVRASPSAAAGGETFVASTTQYLRNES